jgi:ribonuclease P protein component
VFRWMPIVQRLKTRPQFQVALACGTVSRTAHFALHRSPLDRSPAGAVARTRGARRKGRSLACMMSGWAPWCPSAGPAARSPQHHQAADLSGGATFEPRLPQAAHVVRLRATFDRSSSSAPPRTCSSAPCAAELLQLFGHRRSRAGGASAACGSMMQRALMGLVGLPVADQPDAGLLLPFEPTCSAIRCRRWSSMVLRRAVISRCAGWYAAIPGVTGA